MRFPIPAWLIADLGVLLAAGDAVGQGTFQNLDFEHPLLPLIPDAVSTVPAASALPGWAVYGS